MFFNRLNSKRVARALWCAAVLSPFAFSVAHADVFAPTARIESQAPARFTLSYAYKAAVDGDTAAIAERAGSDPASPGETWAGVTVHVKQNGQGVRQAS